ncbi:MAG: helix-turn-helix domain-containing protein [Ruminiclostridium sp.]|nr:helix-turn-helix domain-containing protein [Ruminiclostridium sp.]
MNEAYDCGMIIKNLREKANMTQQELGKKINRDKGIISRYENNYQAVPFETMREFASIFNVSMDYLAGMEKRNTVDAAMLTEAQVNILKSLAENFRENNRTTSRKLTASQYELIGKIVAEFLR